MLYSRARLVAVGAFAALSPAAAFTAAPYLRPTTAAATMRFSSAPLLSESAPVSAAPVDAAGEDCGCAEDTTGVVTSTGAGVRMNDVFVTGATLRSTEVRSLLGAIPLLFSASLPPARPELTCVRDRLWPAQLVDASGTRKTIGSVVGEEGKAVVIFLRHLG